MFFPFLTKVDAAADYTLVICFAERAKTHARVQLCAGTSSDMKIFNEKFADSLLDIIYVI